MKIRLLTIILGITILFVGCGNSIVKKSIEQAKILIENKEYDKAILSLEMALDEDNKNEEANKLYLIIDSYQKAKKAIDENNIEETKKSLDSIDKDYVNYSIKDDIDSLKSEIDNYYKEMEKISVYLTEAESLFNENKYGECKVYLSSNILGSQGDNIESNKYATEKQKEKALEIVDKCERAIVEEEQKETQRLAEEARIAEEQKKQQQLSNFTAEKAIEYVVNIYGEAELGHEYRVGSEGMKNNGKNYYEVYYGVQNRPLSPGADYYGYNVFEDGTVNKFLDNFILDNFN